MNNLGTCGAVRVAVRRAVSEAVSLAVSHAVFWAVDRAVGWAVNEAVDRPHPHLKEFLRELQEGEER